MSDKKIFTLPNALSALRLILLPPILKFYRNPATRTWAAVLLVISCLSDAIDGWVARRFNAISELGKALDPFADKLTQVVLLLCLMTPYPQTIVLLAVTFLRELVVGALNLRYYRRYGKVAGAKWAGKLSAVVLDVTLVVLFFFSRLPEKAVWWLILLCSGLSLFAAVWYCVYFRRVDREQE
ncbi:MAG: CDP-alcohol phosphatidyltransferase family protein [Clostridia bacterium]|nr:CDP-alcohol phosphatidyltransferase family protein [Clostridia bacterium]